MSVPGLPIMVHQTASLPATLSPSRASDYHSCQLKFFFTAVDRWRTPPTEHTALGNLVHEVIEQLYLLDQPDRTRAKAGQLLDEAWPEWAAKPDYVTILNPQIRQKAALSLDGLFALEDPTTLTVDPEHVEAWVEATLYGAPIRGRIDRMTAEGIWRVSDYKTGRVPAARYVEKALAGLFTYAAALAASHPDKRIPDEVELLYLLGPKRIRRPVLRPYLLDHAGKLDATWTNINTSYDGSTWHATTGPLCNYCDFATACPARNRNAPTPGSPESHELLAARGLTRSPSAVPDLGRDPDRDAAEVAVSE
ncbi:MAG: putative RecB family exonuclease [Frankiales bacterium]|nr:putative RecB family exonuclease [Frankiales bacterium]